MNTKLRWSSLAAAILLLTLVASPAQAAPPKHDGPGYLRQKGFLAASSQSGSPVQILGVGASGSDEHASVVVGTNAQGKVAGYAIAWDSSAKSDYQFRILRPGHQVQLVSGSDGSVLVVSDDQPMGLLEVPWAKDSSGKALTTTYEVKGDTVTQHISLVGAAFPVVADPTLTIGWPMYTIRWNRSETHDMATAGPVYMAGVIAACAALGGGVGAGVCTVASAALVGTAVLADNHNQCVRLSWTIAWWTWYGAC